MVKKKRIADFKAYQKFTNSTAVYPKRGKNIVYPTLGLVGEAGEVAEKVKKIIRDNKGKITKEKKEELLKEIGDVLWYISQVSYELNTSLEDIVNINVDKLTSRIKRGKVHGSGDNR